MLVVVLIPGQWHPGLTARWATTWWCVDGDSKGERKRRQSAGPKKRRKENRVRRAAGVGVPGVGAGACQAAVLKPSSSRLAFGHPHPPDKDDNDKTHNLSTADPALDAKGKPVVFFPTRSFAHGPPRVEGKGPPKTKAKHRSEHTS